MAQEFSRGFYHSKAWKHTRLAYIKAHNGLCERCLRRGKITPGDTLHHKIKLTPDNINDPNITLNPDNLELLCRDCHAEVHSFDHKKIDPADLEPRVYFDSYGNVVKKD